MKYYPNFSDVFDDLFDSGVNTTKANTMLCDIRETENTYEMNIALPGYKKEDIALELKNGYLKVSASAKKEETAGRIVRRERYSGNCSRSFYVGEEFTEEDIKANGIKLNTLETLEVYYKPEDSAVYYVATTKDKKVYGVNNDPLHI